MPRTNHQTDGHLWQVQRSATKSEADVVFRADVQLRHPRWTYQVEFRHALETLLDTDLAEVTEGLF